MVLYNGYYSATLIYLNFSIQFTSSFMSDSLRPHGLQHARPPSITNLWSLLTLMPIELVMPSDHLILCHPLLLLPHVKAFI